MKLTTMVVYPFVLRVPLPPLPLPPLLDKSNLTFKKKNKKLEASLFVTFTLDSLYHIELPELFFFIWTLHLLLKYKRFWIKTLSRVLKLGKLLEVSRYRIRKCNFFFSIFLLHSNHCDQTSSKCRFMLGGLTTR